MGAHGLQHLDVPNLKGRMGEGEKKKFDPSHMKSSISGRLKKSRTDMGGAIEEKSPNYSQLKKGEIKPRRARRP